jgi:hypothetical protein
VNDTSVYLARLAAAGGALFAVGNLLHPLDHGDDAEQSATWATAHLTFAVGAVLICAGLPALMRALGGGRLTRVGGALTWLGMLLIPVGSYFEVFVATELSDSVTEDIEANAAAFGAVQALLFMAGPILLGIAALRARSWPVPAPAGLIAGTALLILTPALPGPYGIWLIAGTSILGAAVTVAGLASARILRAADQRGVAPQSTATPSGSCSPTIPTTSEVSGTR